MSALALAGWTTPAKTLTQYLNVLLKNMAIISNRNLNILTNVYQGASGQPHPWYFSPFIYVRDLNLLDVFPILDGAVNRAGDPF